MKKLVEVKGQSKRVEFKCEVFNKTVSEVNRNEGTSIFVIDGSPYFVKFSSLRGRSGKMNVTYTYDGRTFPDNEKQIIEYILNKPNDRK